MPDGEILTKYASAKIIAVEGDFQSGLLYLAVNDYILL